MDSIFFEITVVICTHNPEESVFLRTLDGLKAQTLDKEKWELLVIDNLSDTPVGVKYDLKWHPNSRVIVEKELGLTPARLKGISEAKGPVLVFVDDDNILARNYLQTAFNIYMEHPYIGAFGGNCIPEYETAPPKYLSQIRMPGTRTVNEDIWSNDYSSRARPIGAGMVIHKVVADKYRDLMLSDDQRKALDRKGTSLMSAGDTDMAYVALDLGYGYGLFKELTLIHIMPKFRIETDYLLRLRKMTRLSNFILQYIRFGTKPNKPSGFLRYRLGQIYRFFKYDSFYRSYLHMNRKALLAFFELLERGELD